MKDIAKIKILWKYCENTVESTNEGIKNTETTLRNLKEHQKFLKIDKILKSNIEATKF